LIIRTTDVTKVSKLNFFGLFSGRKMAKRIVVAMSGGVDSSVATYLLKEAGYEVVGITMDLVEASCGIERPDTCCSLLAFADARDVSDKLGIEHYIIDYRVEFEREVISYFVNEYLKGRTPNPCIVCNYKIKFGYLLDKAKELKADYIATGHYAKIESKNGRYVIKKAIDTARDQSYFLYRLSQTQLRHTIMPLGEYKKEEVRKIASKLGLKVHNKHSSQEICFIPNGDYRNFIQQKVKNQLIPGEIVDKAGGVLGRHQGIAFYTVGQRKGLGIAVGRPLYVIAVDAVKNTIIVGEETDIYTQELIADEINWQAIDKLTQEIEIIAQIRYLHKGAPAIISPLDDGRVKVRFREPQRAITPGQSVVFYQNNMIVGGGVIDKVE